MIYNIIKENVKDIDYLRNKSHIEKKITNELLHIGYNFRHKGSHYILESILYAFEHKDYYYANNIEKNIYKYIAYIHNTSVNNIKTNIIRATNLAYTCQSESIITDYFKIEMKMKPKDVINRVLSKIDV